MIERTPAPTWEDALDAVIATAAESAGGFVQPAAALDFIETELQMTNPDFRQIAVLAFRQAAVEDPNDETAAERLYELLVNKQTDYGHNNIMSTPHPQGPIGGIKVRMWDKVSRLRNLTEVRGNSTAVDEPIQETWDDVFGYAVIGLMVLNGTFTLPLEEDMTWSITDKGREALARWENEGGRVAHTPEQQRVYFELLNELRVLQAKVAAVLGQINAE